MSGQSERGFTLIELIVAFSIIAITFSVLLELLSSGIELYDASNRKFSDLLTLDSKVKEGKLQEVDVKEEDVPDFPRVKEVIYTYGEVSIIRYTLK